MRQLDKDYFSFDFDGVIADTDDLKYTVAKDLGFVSCTNACPKKSLSELSPTEISNVNQCVYSDPAMILRLKPKDDAIETIGWLQKQGVLCQVVTSREGCHHNSLKEWFAKFELAIHIECVGVGKNKTPFLEYSKVFVDNRINNLLPAIGCVRYLFYMSDTSTNLLKENSDIVTVYNWQDLKDKLQTLV